MQTLIRPATAQDANGIAAIYNQIIRDTTITFAPDEKSETEIIAAISEADCYLVCDAGGEVTGFGSYAPFRKGAGYARVKEHSICLSRTARGAGLGAELLAALEGHAKAAGVRAMIAGVSGENLPGQKFHAREGYKIVGQLPGVGHKFGRALDLVLMQKNL